MSIDNLVSSRSRPRNIETPEQSLDRQFGLTVADQLPKKNYGLWGKLTSAALALAIVAITSCSSCRCSNDDYTGSADAGTSDAIVQVVGADGSSSDAAPSAGVGPDPEEDDESRPGQDFSIDSNDLILEFDKSSYEINDTAADAIRQYVRDAHSRGVTSLNFYGFASIEDRLDGDTPTLNHRWYNQWLSVQRARAVKRIADSEIGELDAEIETTARGYGETVSRSAGQSEDELSPNRYVLCSEDEEADPEPNPARHAGRESRGARQASPAPQVQPAEASAGAPTAPTALSLTGITIENAGMSPEYQAAVLEPNPYAASPTGAILGFVAPEVDAHPVGSVPEVGPAPTIDSPPVGPERPVVAPAPAVDAAEEGPAQAGEPTPTAPPAPAAPAQPPAVPLQTADPAAPAAPSPAEPPATPTPDQDGATPAFQTSEGADVYINQLPPGIVSPDAHPAIEAVPDEAVEQPVGDMREEGPVGVEPEEPEPAPEPAAEPEEQATAKGGMDKVSALLDDANPYTSDEEVIDAQLSYVQHRISTTAGNLLDYANMVNSIEQQCVPEGYGNSLCDIDAFSAECGEDGDPRTPATPGETTVCQEAFYTAQQRVTLADEDVEFIQRRLNSLNNLIEQTYSQGIPEGVAAAMESMNDSIAGVGMVVDELEQDLRDYQSA